MCDQTLPFLLWYTEQAEKHEMLPCDKIMTMERKRLNEREQS